MIVQNTHTVHISTKIPTKHKTAKTTLKIDDNWVVVVRRVSGAVNFQRPWKDYVAGFGDPVGNFWIGLDNLYRITHSKSHMLRVDVEDWRGKKYFAEYSHFSVGPASTHYKLRVTGYNVHSSGGDSLGVSRWWRSVHNGRRFSTFDNDNDRFAERNCAKMFKGGWWYDGCHSSNPIGYYYSHARIGEMAYDGITWYSATGKHETMKYIQYKIRRVL